jgi:hypothetical protein
LIILDICGLIEDDSGACSVSGHVIGNSISGLPLKKGLPVSVYKYTVVLPDREDSIESGTVLAKDEGDATKKLKRLDLSNPRLKEVKGISGFVGRFTADVK